MFSPVLGRVVRSSCTISGVSSVCTASRPAAITALGAKQSLSRRPQHQRRLSSSKASIPPNDSNKDTKPEESLREAKRSTAKAAEQTAEQAAESNAAKPTGKVAKPAAKKSTPAPRNIPHVPALDYLKPADALHANFYSLHRPMSITDTLPMPQPDEFDAIFEKKKPSSVFYSGIDSVDDALSRLDIDRVQHELNRIPPFHPPPAPAPRNITDFSTTGQQQAPTSKSWSTNIVLTETTHVSGKRTLSVSAAPMVECPSPVEDVIDHVQTEQQPFLTRMMQREREMQLISVKRQRKLKMKKHKYKKLMKRTRLLRRKLDRT